MDKIIDYLTNNKLIITMTIIIFIFFAFTFYKKKSSNKSNKVNQSTKSTKSTKSTNTIKTTPTKSLDKYWKDSTNNNNMRDILNDVNFNIESNQINDTIDELLDKESDNLMSDNLESLYSLSSIKSDNDRSLLSLPGLDNYSNMFKNI